MNNCVQLLLEILYFKKEQYRNLQITYCSLLDYIEEKETKKVFAICGKDSDLWIKEDIIFDITNLNMFIYNEQEEVNEVVETMFEYDGHIEPTKYTLLCINKFDDMLGSFEHDFNELVKIYNSLSLRDREKLITDNVLTTPNVEYKLQTTYFEILSTPHNINIKKYLKDNNLKINFEQFILK